MPSPHRRKVRTPFEGQIAKDKKVVWHPGPAQAVTFLSVNGQLQSTRELVPASDHKQSVYQPVEIGEPLIIQYLRFAIVPDSWESGDNELLISTYLKTTATKPVAAEAITLYDPHARPNDHQQLIVEDWGARRYGNPLIYYSPSYRGEPLSLSTQVLELDKLDQDMVDAMVQLAGNVSNMPLLTAFLPYAGMIGTAVGAVAELLVTLHNLFNKDDLLVPYFDLDLYPPHAAAVRPLQCGRYVHVPELAADNQAFQEEYELEPDNNKLVRKDDGTEYAGAYLVFKVNAESHPTLSDFDALAGAGELLDTIRPQRGSLRDVVEATTQAAQATADMVYLRELLMFEYELPDPALEPQVRAIWRHLSDTARMAYSDQFEALLKKHAIE